MGTIQFPGISEETVAFTDSLWNSSVAHQKPTLVYKPYCIVGEPTDNLNCRIPWVFFELGLTSISTNFRCIRTVPACNRGYHIQFIVLSHWSITPQAQQYEIPTGHIILPKGQPVFVLNYLLYDECLTRELQLPILKLWFDSAGNRTRASQSRSERFWGSHGRNLGDASYPLDFDHGSVAFENKRLLLGDSISFISVLWCHLAHK